MKKKQIVKAAILNDSESDVDIPNEIIEKVLKKKSKLKIGAIQDENPTENLLQFSNIHLILFNFYLMYNI